MPGCCACSCLLPAGRGQEAHQDCARSASQGVLPGPALHYPALPCPALPCPALPCPALPCPALPCPALPCPARNQDCIVVIRRCLVLFSFVHSGLSLNILLCTELQPAVHRSACWNKLPFVMMYLTVSRRRACLVVLDSCPSLCHCLVASVDVKTCGPHADSSVASILQSEHTSCQFLVPDAALSC